MKTIETLIQRHKTIEEEFRKEMELIQGENRKRLEPIEEAARKIIEQVFKNKSEEILVVFGSESSEYSESYDDNDKLIVCEKKSGKEISDPHIIPFSCYEISKSRQIFIKMIGFCKCYHGREYSDSLILANNISKEGKIILIEEVSRNIPPVIFSPFGSWEIEEG